MNAEIDIVTITRVLADGSHVSLGDSSSTIEQLVSALDAMTEGKEVLDDIFTHQTIKVADYGGDVALKPPSGKMPPPMAGQHASPLANRFLVF